MTSIPAVDVRTAERVVTDVVGKNFPTAGHLAARRLTIKKSTRDT